MDSIDRRILKLLQEDASLPLAALAERVGLSPTPCWRRIQKLKAAGVIRKQVTLVDPASVNLGVTVFVAVRTNEHTPQWLERFAKGVADIPEVLELYRMSGEVDYLLRVVVPDIAGYDRVYRKLIKAANLHDVSSSFAMECIKYTTALPLEHASASR
ncbi:MAG TPA: Lrp/AsnC family transcriptional regulator [Burkholderiales bacterium]|nr:Lrp/AsnC family transcriptional regulator [Burkholderiales bacterium]